MQAFDVNKKEMNAFDFGETYLFTAYFDENQIFNQIEKYHNFDNYRFEVLKEGVKKVQQVLHNFLHELVVQKSPEEFCIVLDRDDTLPNILTRSVVNSRVLTEKCS
jgi:hypothetical protein